MFDRHSLTAFINNFFFALPIRRAYSHVQNIVYLIFQIKIAVNLDARLTAKHVLLHGYELHFNSLGYLL